MPEPYDVAIVGGGIAGLSLAYFLCEHRSVVVLERETALGYHSTGRSAAEFTHRFHPPIVNRLAAISYRFLVEPPDGFTDTALLARRGNLVVAAEEKKARLEELFAREVAIAPGLEMLTPDQALERAPILRRDYVAAAFYDDECWDMDVDAILQGFVRGARARGGVVRTDAEILSAERDGAGWAIETKAGSVRARTVVNAAGGWADGMAELFGVRPLGIVPHRRTAILVDAPGDVDVAALPEISEVDEQFYMKPDAGRLLVSPADETPVTPYDAQAEEIDIATAAWYLEQATSVPVRTIAHSWAGLRSFTPDRLPVVGYSGEAEGFFWLAGQGGFGILSSPALGLLAADLLAGQALSEVFVEHGLERERLSPKRLEGSF